MQKHECLVMLPGRIARHYHHSAELASEAQAHSLALRGWRRNVSPAKRLKPCLLPRHCTEVVDACHSRPQANGGDTAMADAGPVEIPSSRVSMLEGHGNEVFICAWSPTAPLLASG